MTKKYPETESRSDFWKQVKRTVHGVPVSQEQIDMIVAAVRAALSFSSDDILLDLGCANGALSNYFFSDIYQLHGVDLSKYLIGIAKEFFEKPPHLCFSEENIVSYVVNEPIPERFTKCLCYGTSHFLAEEDIKQVLELVYLRFTNISTIFIGNSPDREKANLFFSDKVDNHSLERHDTSLGTWRTKDHLASLTGKWKIEFRNMPKDYHSSYYRFDAILKR